MKNKKYYSDFKLTLESDKVDTIIGDSVVVNGPIISRKDIRIEGKVFGDVKTKGNLFIADSSEIKGIVVGKNITICGKITGDVFAKGRIIIAAKAFVDGDLTMENLVVDEGGFFIGKSTMTTDKSIFKKARKEKIENNEESPDEEQVVIEYKE